MQLLIIKWKITLGKDKLKRFAETATFPNFLQPDLEDIKEGYYLKGRWGTDFLRIPSPSRWNLDVEKGSIQLDLQNFIRKRIL
ncbi:MAG: hypothetical protein R2764_19310 [Bacteroidales bacterium]